MAKRLSLYTLLLITVMIAALILIGCNRKPAAETQPSTAASQPEETQVQTDPEETATIGTAPTETATVPQSTQKPNNAEGVEQWEEATTAKPTNPTQSSETTAATDPTKTTEETQNGEEDLQQTLTYEAYLQLSNAQQQEFFRSFAKVDDFYQWLDAAQAEYEKEHPGISGSGGIDIGDYIP